MLGMVLRMIILHLFQVCIYFINLILVLSKTKRIPMSTHFQSDNSWFLSLPLEKWLIWVLRLSNRKQGHYSIFQIHILRFFKWNLIDSISFSFKLNLLNAMFGVKLFIILNINIISYSVSTGSLGVHHQIASASNLLSIESFWQNNFFFLIHILNYDFLFLIHVFIHCEFVFNFFSTLKILLNIDHAS